MTTPTATASSEAVRFINQLIGDAALMRDYLTALNPEADAPSVAGADAWLAANGYRTTVADLITAQEQVWAEQLSYWSGGYETEWMPAGTPGPPVTVVPAKDGVCRIGLGAEWLIAPVFTGSRLTWDESDGLNDTHGSLLFGTAAATDGGLLPALDGTVTDADGTRRLLGALSDKSLAGTPLGQDAETTLALGTAFGAVVALLAVTGITALRSRKAN